MIQLAPPDSPQFTITVNVNISSSANGKPTQAFGMDLDDVASHNGFGQHMATYNVEVSPPPHFERTKCVV